jgi:crossover junction endodeoxyribonuclease RusA
MSAGAQEFELPWPPSVNHYYRHVGPRVLISRDGRRYREKVVAMLGAAGVSMHCRPVEIAIDLYPPDARRRDVDNSLKCLLDTLAHAGLYKDDSQIRKLTVTKHSPMPPAGMARIKTKEWTGEQATGRKPGDARKQ